MTLNQISTANTEGTLDEFLESAKNASQFLKALAHESRLLILCHLSYGEKSVNELEKLLAARQAAVSQQLARLRLDGLVDTRRDGKIIYYSLSDSRVINIMGAVREAFCPPDNKI